MGKTEEIQVKEGNTTLIVRNSDNFRKSNQLISSKHNSTITENKLLCLSLSKANQMRAETVEINGENVKVFTSELKSNELIKNLNISRKNLPAQIRNAYKNMVSRQIGVENEDTGEFQYRSLIIGGDYINGTLKLYYNPLLTAYYRDISKGFTLLSVSQLMKFKSNHSLRLYELLKKECYTSKANKKTSANKIVYEISFNVAELKLSLGVINANETAVQKVLSKPGPPNWDEAVAKAKEKGYERWSDFRRRCLTPAINELNDIGEFVLTYTVGKSGQGGKVNSITFFVEYDNASVEDVLQTPLSLTEDEKIDFYDQIADVITEKLKYKETKAIAEAAKYDIEIIREKYEIAKSQNIDNLVGWMLKAIENDYQKPRKTAKAVNHGFKERDYDFDELLKDII